MSDTPPIPADFNITTAAALTAYRDELLEGGFTADQAFELVRQAAQSLVSECGLGVRTPKGDAS